MKIIKINYSQSKESANSIGLKSWIKIGVEVDVEEGDSPDDALRAAKEKVEEWYSGIANAEIFHPQPQFREPEQLPVIQEKDR